MGPEPVLKSRLSGPTRLIGREQEVDAVRHYLLETQTRLLTLVGPGGIGKTSLAQHIAIDLQDAFADGISFVSLAHISDPELIIPTIAQALKIKEVGGVGGLSIPELLVAFLQDKQLLLLLDNFEQVTSAAPKLSELLGLCPSLKILVTSRAVLNVRDEQEFRVLPLALPDLKHLPEWEKLSQYAAVKLFLQYAQARKPGFTLTSGNARAIAESCVYLDGIPLAIGLAATYIKVLSPQTLLQRLKMQRLEMLTHGAQDAPPRQHNLRNTLMWSYSLLEDSEQMLFRRLSIFVGGCSLEALEKVSKKIEGRESHVLAGVASLIDKSLLQQNEREEEPRFLMLETIREYGRECLRECSEEEAARQAHALYYLELVETAAPKLRSSEQEQWFQRLEQDYENLRAAFDWLLAREEVEHALRLTGAFWWYWLIRGDLSEGRQWLERALSCCKEEMVAARAETLISIGMLALMQGDIAQADRSFSEGLALSRKISNIYTLAFSLQGQGMVAWVKNDPGAARTFTEQAVEFWKQIDEKEGMAWSLCTLATIAAHQYEYARAFALAEEGLASFKASSDAFGIAYGLLRMSEVMFLQGNAALKKKVNATAHTLLHESLEIFKQLGNRWGTAQAFSLSGRMVAARGDQREAYSFYKKGLEVALESHDKGNIVSSLDIASCLEGLAYVKVSQGYPDLAVQCWGIAETLRKTIGVPLLIDSPTLYESSVTTARDLLGEEAFANAWAKGHTMKPEQALDLLVLQEAKPQPVDYPDELTPREVDVLCLIAKGLTDAQVAEKLIISPRTVNTHLTAIYSKIGVSNRSGATHYAIQHNLISVHDVPKS